MSFDTAQNFSKQVALLADAEGVSPTTVLRDISKSSETIAKFTSMTPDNLAKASYSSYKIRNKFRHDCWFYGKNVEFSRFIKC